MVRLTNTIEKLGWDKERHTLMAEWRHLKDLFLGILLHPRRGSNSKPWDQESHAPPTEPTRCHTKWRDLNFWFFYVILRSNPYRKVHKVSNIKGIVQLLFFLSLLIYFEREKVQVGKGREREGERENPKPARSRRHRARSGAPTHQPWDHDLSRNRGSGA